VPIKNDSLEVRKPSVEFFPCHNADHVISKFDMAQEADPSWPAGMRPACDARMSPTFRFSTVFESLLLIVRKLQLPNHAIESMEMPENHSLHSYTHICQRGRRWLMPTLITVDFITMGAGARRMARARKII